jgi:hypothetical protein
MVRNKNGIKQKIDVINGSNIPLFIVQGYHQQFPSRICADDNGGRDPIAEENPVG